MYLVNMNFVFILFLLGGFYRMRDFVVLDRKLVFCIYGGFIIVFYGILDNFREI